MKAYRVRIISLIFCIALSAAASGCGEDATSPGPSYLESIDCPRVELESFDDCTYSGSRIKFSETSTVEEFCRSTCNKASVGVVLDGYHVEERNGPTDLAMLRGLEEIDHLIIEFAPTLESLDGLEQLRRVHDRFYLMHNANLESLSALRSLETVELDLQLVHLDSLTSLDGLQSLRQLKRGGLVIEYNKKLESIEELSNFESVGSGLVVQGNGNLPACQAAQLAAQLELEDDMIKNSGNGAGTCN